MKNNIDRKQFLKKSCLGLCAAAAFLNTGNSTDNPDENVEMDARQRFLYEWISCFLKSVEDEVGEEIKMKIMDRSAEFCFSRFKEKISEFKGDLHGFLAFLQNDWKIYSDYDEVEGVINAEYDVEKCPCPLVHESIPQQSRLLCYCTQGFNRRMYETVLGRPVETEVKKTLLWGDGSCESRSKSVISR